MSTFPAASIHTDLEEESGVVQTKRVKQREAHTMWHTEWPETAS